MGNDGGSIPTRRELVKEAARNPTVTELKSTLSERLQHLWTTDPLSNKPLAEPIVSDSNGRLYNKDSILEYLLPSEDDGGMKAEADKILAGAVSSLKDVIELKFTSSPRSDADPAVGSAAQWECPITSEPLGPSNKAVYIVPCGHVFSATAIKEVAADTSRVCLVCNEEYAENDVIPVLPTAETDVARLVLRVKTLKESGLRHSLKAIGKKKEKRDREKKDKIVEVKKSAVTGPTINNAATKALTDKVVREQEATKKRKLDNANVQSLFTQKDPKERKRDGDFMTRGFSIPANAKR